MNRLHLITRFHFILAIVVLTLVGCNNEDENKISEGFIEYDVTYPYYKDSFMMGLLPKKMILNFKNGVYTTSIDEAFFGTTLISNCKDSTLIMTLRFSGKKLYTELDAALTDTMIQKNGVPDLINLNSTDSIVGVLCKKHMAVFDNLSDGYDSEVLETEKINLKNSNWCNPYRGIDGVLMGYEVDQFGLQMRFRASMLKDTIVSDSLFIVPSDYKKIPLERMLYEVEQLFNSL